MSERSPLILVVEDDIRLARLNARLLIRHGYNVLIAYTVSEARAVFERESPDLVVLDIELPDGDGRSLCKEFRKRSDVPVVFLTGKIETEDRVEGLGSGADYYLTKPFDRNEFVAVIKSQLRRMELNHKKIEEAFVITRGALTLMLDEQKAYVAGRDAGLTPKEFAVLLLLVQNEDRELSCTTIYESVWKTKMNNDAQPVRLHISRLKKKLREEKTADYFIVSLYNKGYMFTRQ
ncbi:MAG: response regulator transcription factor [Peptococcaceae bacterium]|nr:response regulator transcription factor [Peptococcaceae bacterium]